MAFLKIKKKNQKNRFPILLPLAVLLCEPIPFPKLHRRQSYHSYQTMDLPEPIISDAAFCHLRAPFIKDTDKVRRFF